MVHTKALSALAISIVFLSGGRLLQSQPPDVRHIDVTASKFSFLPSEITVKKDETVMLTLHSEDATHGLLIKGLGIRVEAHKGQTENVSLTPQASGTFEGKCAHFCGKGHGSMIFTVHVVE